MKSKTWCILSLSLALAILVLAGTATAWIDPYFHYHAPLEGIAYPLNNQRYQNDGIVRHFSYDALITGTSLTENFKNTELDQLFGVHSVKACYSGGSYGEIFQNLEQAVRNQPELKLVVFGMDEWFLLGGKDLIEAKGDYPTYLYDDNPVNDVNYLLNREILCNATLEALSYTRKGNVTTSFDDFNAWGHLFLYGPKQVFNSYNRQDQAAEKKVLTQEQADQIERTLRDTALRLAEENPQITFLYFFPPYSILNWDNHQREGSLEFQVAAFKKASEVLLEADNIQLYSFYTDLDTIVNLDNYRDIVHYSPEINSLILSRMQKGEYRLTKDNCQEHWKSVLDFYGNYDYDRLFSEAN